MWPIAADFEWLYFSAKNFRFYLGLKPKLNPDLKSVFKPKLRLASVLARSFRL